MERPDSIEKRVFRCKGCSYEAQVFGESYFDYGCHNYMATFECNECAILFESLISQINMDEVAFEAHHGLADEIICLRCGKANVEVWNRESDSCPKCQGKMCVEIIGNLRVRF